MAYPVRLSPAVKSVRVRALHDGESIAFRLQWEDRVAHMDILNVDRFADQCAVMLLPYGIPEGELSRAWQMGSKSYPATILNWRADWQADVNRGRLEVEDLYTNMAIDRYPPYAGTVREGAKPRGWARCPRKPSDGLPA